MTFLAVCGSLRAVSSNQALVRAAALLAPPEVTVTIYDRLGDIPPFNPDNDGSNVAEAVVHWRAQLRAADGLILASPEYAHGVSGVLKNVLDWVVGSGELMGKPIALLNGSGRATIAYAALRDILTTMDAHVVPSASRVLVLDGRKLDGAGVAADPALAAQLRACLDALVDAVGRLERP